MRLLVFRVSFPSSTKQAEIRAVVTVPGFKDKEKSPGEEEQGRQNCRGEDGFRARMAALSGQAAITFVSLEKHLHLVFQE